MASQGLSQSPVEAVHSTPLPFPRYYLDFETLHRPYSAQVPLQWSCHVERELGQLQHAMFLEMPGNDSRRACAEALIAALGTTGPVFVYGQAFEKNRITAWAALFLDLAPALLAMNERIVDLPATHAPELDNAELAIGRGRDVHGALDTLAMVRLAWILEGYSVWDFLPSLVAGTQSALLPSPKAQTSPPDPLLHSAEETLRQYCVAANTRMVLQPKSYLQRRLRISFSHATLLMNQLEAFGILSPQENVLSRAGDFSPMATN